MQKDGKRNVLTRKNLVILLIAAAMLFSAAIVLRSCGRDVGDDITKNKSQENLNQEVSESLSSSDYNDDRWLKIKVKLDGEYVYESDFLKPQDVLKMDIIKENNLDIEGKNAVAEIYSYTADKQFITMSEIIIQDDIQ